MRTYASVLDVPEPIDMATVYVQPEIGLQLLPEFEQKGIPEIWFNPGAENTTGDSRCASYSPSCFLSSNGNKTVMSASPAPPISAATHRERPRAAAGLPLPWHDAI